MILSWNFWKTKKTKNVFIMAYKAHFGQTRHILTMFDISFLNIQYQAHISFYTGKIEP